MGEGDGKEFDIGGDGRKRYPTLKISVGLRGLVQKLIQNRGSIFCAIWTSARVTPETVWVQYRIVMRR